MKIFFFTLQPSVVRTVTQVMATVTSPESASEYPQSASVIEPKLN